MEPKGAATFKRFRELRGHSLEDVGLAVGVSEGAVWQWEVGRTTPRRNTAVKVDRYLDADGEVLAAFGYAPITPPPDELAELRTQLAALATLVHSLDADVQTLGAEVKRLRSQSRRAAGGT